MAPQINLGRPVRSDDELGLDGELDNAEIEYLRAQNTQLEEALKSTRMIGAAIGIIMATKKVTYEQAFNHLAAASQDCNVKLRVLAEEIVLTGEMPRR